MKLCTKRTTSLFYWLCKLYPSVCCGHGESWLQCTFDEQCIDEEKMLSYWRLKFVWSMSRGCSFGWVCVFCSCLRLRPGWFEALICRLWTNFLSVQLPSSCLIDWNCIEWLQQRCHMVQLRKGMMQAQSDFWGATAALAGSQECFIYFPSVFAVHKLVNSVFHYLLEF